MTIQQIYDEYKIPPFLQLHQLRVAAVAKMLCDAGLDVVQERDMIKTCLVHDMGNIIKFDMDMFYESWDPEGTAYWNGVKDDFKRRYGGDEMRATLNIIEELGLNGDIRGTVRGSGFGNAQSALASNSWPVMVLIYCDMRVKPYGVSSLSERVDDLQERYKNHMSSSVPRDKKEFSANAKAIEKIEDLIFKNVKKLGPKDVTDERANELIPDLKKYVIN